MWSNIGANMAESGRLPDSIVRRGMRRIIGASIKNKRPEDPEKREELVQTLVEELKDSPIAITPDAANQQHYELPPEFFSLVLGPYNKYSCCLWEEGTETIEAAEETMLDLTCRRAGIEDGMTILDLGCGWGAMSLWMAKRFPDASITAVSNSVLQGDFIRGKAEVSEFRNLRVIRADVQDYRPDTTFHRIVSVEMFEHVRNYAELLKRIADWLYEDGRLFVHHFCHRDMPYTMDADDERDWMARLFFTGGLMPSEQLLSEFRDDMTISDSWTVSGLHYARTLRTWLATMDSRHDEVMSILHGHYGPSDARLWFNRWRMFFMACEELFAYRNGTEWFVVHHVFKCR